MLTQRIVNPPKISFIQIIIFLFFFLFKHTFKKKQTKKPKLKTLPFKLHDVLEKQALSCICHYCWIALQVHHRYLPTVIFLHFVASGLLHTFVAPLKCTWLLKALYSFYHIYPCTYIRVSTLDRKDTFTLMVQRMEQFGVQCLSQRTLPHTDGSESSLLPSEDNLLYTLTRLTPSTKIKIAFWMQPMTLNSIMFYINSSETYSESHIYRHTRLADYFVMWTLYR